MHYAIAGVGLGAILLTPGVAVIKLPAGIVADIVRPRYCDPHIISVGDPDGAIAPRGRN